MGRAFFSLKNKLTLLTVTVSFVVTVFLASISFLFSQTYVKNNLIQTTGFNLQLISKNVSQYVSAINNLGSLISFNSSISSWCDDDESTEQDSLFVYNRVKEEFQHNKANIYIRRLIIYDKSLTKFIQVGSCITESKAVTIYSLNKIPITAKNWQELSIDPFDLEKGDEDDPSRMILPLIFPIFKNGTSTAIGYVYMSIDFSIITSQLENYVSMNTSRLFLTLGGNHYQITKSTLIPSSQETYNYMSDIIYSANNQNTQDKNLSTIVSVINEKGRKKTLVSFPLGDMWFSEIIAKQSFIGKETYFWRMLICICFCIALMGIGTWVALYRIITIPVSKIRNQLAIIESGQFVMNPHIEWANEMGDIGRSINSLSENMSVLMDKRVADEKNKHMLEYRVLQGQINPHFLYNTLNSIRWMATLQNAEGIAEMTMSLARLLKNIAKDSDSVITLENELSLLDDYFLIQQYRYGGTINLSKNIDSSVLKTGIPRFSLQPLMENAIFHGIESKGICGEISIVAQRDVNSLGNNIVRITLTDNGMGMLEEEIRKIFEGTGTDDKGLFKNVGILNVHKRIKYEFGSDYGLSIVSEKNKYTTITIEVPEKNV